MADKKDSFLFYRSYIEAVDKLPIDRRYTFIRAIAVYALDCQIIFCEEYTSGKLIHDILYREMKERLAQIEGDAGG